MTYLLIAVVPIAADVYYSQNIINLECDGSDFKCDISDSSEPKTSHLKAFIAAPHDEWAFVLNEDINGLPFVVHED